MNVTLTCPVVNVFRAARHKYAAPIHLCMARTLSNRERPTGDENPRDAATDSA
jgi:hypothetical protein